MKNLKTILIASVASIATILGVAPATGVLPPALASAGQSPATVADRAKFPGTYSLVSIERKNESGTWMSAPDFNSIGYIIYADTGHMAVHIMPRVRARLTSNPPSAQEAQTALRGYTAYYGPFTVDDKQKIVTHRRAGHIDAGATDFRRYYDFVPDPRNPRGGFERLILTPVPNNGGKEQATTRLIWERMPEAPLSAEEKKFVGFYKLLYTDSYRIKDGKEVFHGDKVETRAGSWIIYTPTGHMMVHLMDRTGPFRPASGNQRTPEEALRAYRGYYGYFGRFVTYENQTPRFVFHSQLGATSPGRYSDQQRFYEFTGDVLRLGAPPTLNAAGELAGGHLYWERLRPVN